MSRGRFEPRPGGVAFVVGGSAGIGLATAEALARRGLHVGLVARRPGPLAEAARRVEAAGAAAAGAPAEGARVATRALDAADEDATRRAFEGLAAALGPPELVVACAGAARPGHFAELPPGRLDETLRANLHTAWSTARAALPLLLPHGGALVLTSSLAGLIGVFGYSDYCAAKFGVVGLAEALRAELRPQGVHVALLLPPDTDTPGFALENETKPAETRAVSEAARLLPPAEVARALLAGLARGRFRIVPGREARWVARAARLAPGLVDRVSARRIERARRGGR